MNAREVAALLKLHGSKYTGAERAKIRRYIRKNANSTINLANDDQASDFGNNKTGAGQAQHGKGHKGKTRTQPRQFGGKFGKKGANNGEQGEPGDFMGPDPEEIIGTINNLQVGQSVMLIGFDGKVKRLGRGYQLYKPSTGENNVVKTLAEAGQWAREQMKEPVAKAKKNAQAEADEEVNRKLKAKAVPNDRNKASR